jgi:predicted alpha/beta-hydrolase family hydrolase
VPLTTEQLIETPHGHARAHLLLVDEPIGGLVLGHGAGGGVGAGDIVAVSAAANAAGIDVVLVEQPYRVAGRRSPAPAHQLDAAWTAVLAELRRGPLRRVPVVTGGRSSGARVACRTAAATGAAGVLCLAFPLQPPQRRTASEPPPSRLGELEAVEVPVLIVQGVGDQFGMPPAAPGRTVVQVKGNHSLAAERPRIAAAARDWLVALFVSS